MFLSLFAGAFLWTFTEYVLHRFLGHFKTKLLLRTRFHKEHTKHHLKKNYFAGPRDKILTLIATGPKIFLLGFTLSGTMSASFFTFGFVAMYLTYELVHFRMHIKAPPHGYASKMRAHHFYHHYVDENMNHGVTTPLWDYVFRTYRKPRTIPFPAKFKQDWFDVSDLGAYRDKWGQLYQQV